MDPAGLRAVAKRWVRWEDPTVGGWRGALRAWMMRDPDVAMRYGPALAAGRSAARVLEVGSGPYGIAPFLRRKVVGVDLSFAGPRHLALLPVRARAEALPFADGTFDLVVCFDVLEHVPPERRSAVVAELGRVCSGTLLVAVPCGPAAEEADRWAEAMSPGGRHRWLTEHRALGLPEPREVPDLVLPVGVPRRDLAYTAIWMWKLLRLEEVRFRPDLTVLRRILLPAFSGWLWRLPGRSRYRRLLEVRPARGGGPWGVATESPRSPRGSA